MRILIIRLSSIGDIFHTFTVLPDIKKTNPNVTIDWLVDENFTGVANLSPLIDNVIPIPLRKWKKNKFTWFNKLANFKKTLSNTKYDYIIDTQGLIKSAMLSKYLFDGYVFGLDRKSAREPIASLFYDFTYNVNQNNIAVPRLRGLIAKIFNLKHDLRKIDFQYKSEDCGINFVNGYILFLHGTSKENKKWSLENWTELSNWVINNSNKQIVITYSNQAEYEFAISLISNLNSERITLIEKLSFTKLADLIVKSDVVIGVDTGFTHFANLTHTPTIAIYLASDPGYVGILESDIAKNLGGKGMEVLVSDVINTIKSIVLN
ncbi:MAG: lipopolysaccharide heptosyltransferase I [Burkholderiales bacterium]|nr:lipopolysaccharide heptosyltransferase I [Burkholderiales bacterium]